MRTLYIECNMGAAGDMLTAALMELIPDRDAFVERMNSIGIPEMMMSITDKTTCGVRGTHVSVKIGDHEEESLDVDAHGHSHADEHEYHIHEHDHHLHEHEHHHAGLGDIEEIVRKLDLPEKVKADVMGVYALIGEAEAFAHGTQVEKVHFHEVGMMDAITDISAVCLLMSMIGAQRVIVSPVCTGFGNVRCMHGILPVPVPAAAYLLRGIPAYAGYIRGELITPTGAALLKYFADSFEAMPVMRVEKIGCGIGMKEFEAANCVRAMLGETEDKTDSVVEISCNLDDMTGEAIGYALQVLLENGALDVYTSAIQMKKNRPGVMLNCICKEKDADRFAELILRHTSTIGVRMNLMRRKTMERAEKTVSTVYGDIRLKESRGYGTVKRKPEYEDCAEAAKKHDVTIMDVIREAENK